MISQKHIRDSERKYVAMVFDRGGFAQRVAGSGCGKYGFCDVVSVEQGFTFAVEIKSTSNPILRLSKLEVERLRELISLSCEHHPLQTKLVVHFKRRGWKEYVLGNVGAVSASFSF